MTNEYLKKFESGPRKSLIKELSGSRSKYFASLNDLKNVKDQETFKKALDSLGIAKKDYKNAVWELAQFGEDYEYEIMNSQLNYLERRN